MGAATAQVRPLRAGPWEAEPSRAEPSRAEPSRAEPRDAGHLRVAGSGPGDGAGPGTGRGNGAGPGGGLAALLAGGEVRSGRELGADSGVVSGSGLLPVLPALQELLPKGALARGSVVSAGPWSLLCLALAAGPVAAGAWCAVAGIPEFGVSAAADAGLDPARLLLVPEPGPGWQQAVASLLDGCDVVVLRPPARLPAHGRRKLEAAVRRHGAVLVVAGDWDGAQVRLRIAAQEWAGIGLGHGRLRGRRAQVVADGRGDWSRARTRWLWLPGPDGTIAAVTPDAAGAIESGDVASGDAAADSVTAVIGAGGPGFGAAGFGAAGFGAGFEAELDADADIALVSSG